MVILLMEKRYIYQLNEKLEGLIYFDTVVYNSNVNDGNHGAQ